MTTNNETKSETQDQSLIAAIEGNWSGMSKEDLISTCQMLTRGRDVWRKEAEQTQSELTAAKAELQLARDIIKGMEGNIAACEADNERLTREQPISSHLRQFDLVRQMRGELHRQNLITDEEYVWLCRHNPTREAGSPSPRRLEDYDELRAKLAEAEKDKERLIKVARRCLDIAYENPEDWRVRIGQAIDAAKGGDGK